MGPAAVALTAMLVGGVAGASTGWLRRVAGRRSRWLIRPILALLGVFAGAGAGLLACNLAELVGYALFGLGCALLLPVDLAVHRLPDVLVGPLYPALLVPLAVAATRTGDGSRLARALLVALLVTAVYFALAWVSPANLGLGDVKLAGVLAAFLGWLGLPQTLLGVLGAFALSLGVALVFVVARRSGRDRSYAFGPCMIIAAALGATFGPALLRG